MGTAPHEDAVQSVLQDNTDVVRKWIAGEAGSWGYLAGQAVMALHRRMGKKLNEEERREVWGLLWNRLADLKETCRPD